MRRRSSVGVARRAAAGLCELLGLPLLDAARPGAVGLLPPPVLLPAADGWVHPGPPTVWPEFGVMARSLGAGPGAPFPDLCDLAAEVIDREAGEWRLPAVAVRAREARPPEVPRLSEDRALDGASVVVLGSAWAAPLAGLALRRLGARVLRVVDPRRPDPFPLRDVLASDQEVLALDLGATEARDRITRLLGDADLLVDATTPRVLANAGLADVPRATVRIAAFADEDRPGYGLAAEARAGWAARHDPPRLGRASVADPIGGLLAAIAAVDVLQRGGRSVRHAVSLESAVGHLFEVERAMAERADG